MTDVELKFVQPESVAGNMPLTQPDGLGHTSAGALPNAHHKTALMFRASLQPS